ncbi:MAG: helix-turn-helix domain-containing protein [Fibrobacterota bacterium]
MSEKKLIVKESSKTEFKRSWRDEYLKTVCAFANSEGGKLFIGIDDDGKTIGIENAQKLLEDIPNKVVHSLGIVVDVKRSIRNGKDVLEINIAESSVPVSYRGRYYYRSGSTVQELQGHKLREFILRKDNITWDEMAVPNADIETLNKQLILRFVKKAVSENRLHNNAEDDDVFSILEKLDLVTEKGELTRAAVMLFGNDAKKYIRTATVKIGKFGKSGADLISQDIIEGS